MENKTVTMAHGAGGRQTKGYAADGFFNFIETSTSSGSCGASTGAKIAANAKIMTTINPIFVFGDRNTCFQYRFWIMLFSVFCFLLLPIL